VKRLLLLLLALSGCAGLGGVRVEALGVATQKPSQVAAYLRVSDEGRPLTALGPESFVVYEDDQALDAERIDARLLEPRLAAAHRTLLLVDNSAATDKGVRQELARAITMFVERVRAVEPISVYAFDGGPEIRAVAEYPRATDAPAPSAKRLAELAPADPSRNLNGAVQKAALRLDALLAADRQPIRVGTLVVFAGGPDLAGRVEPSSLRATLDEREHAVIAIGIGEDAGTLREIARDGYFDAHSADTLSLAFEEAAHRVHARYQQHYLFAYCSPARAGKRRLRLEVRLTGEDGATRSGEAQAEFDATGFSAGCEPNAPPRFESRAPGPR